MDWNISGFFVNNFSTTFIALDNPETINAARSVRENLLAGMISICS